MRSLSLYLLLPLLLFTGCPKVVGNLCYDCEPDKHPYEIQLEDPRYSQSITVLGRATHPDSLIAVKKAMIDAESKVTKQLNTEISNIMKALDEEYSTIVNPCESDGKALLTADSIHTTDNQIIKKRADGRFDISILTYVSAATLLSFFETPCLQEYPELTKSNIYKEVLQRVTKERSHLKKPEY